MTTDKLPEWVMVPREPTPEMMEAGWDAGEGNETPDYANAYRAMLAAAPPREVVVDEAMVRRAAIGYYSTDTMPEKWEPDAVHLRRMFYALTAALTHPQGDNDGK